MADARPPLYPFQAEDIGIMEEQLRVRGYAVSHHEQGLGKSRMAIEIGDRMKAKHMLVLCPAIGRVSWAEEPTKWGTIMRKDVILKGSADIRKLDKIGSHASIVTVTYDLCRNPKVRAALRDFGFAFAVLDEFQQLRNPAAKRTQAVYARKDGVISKIPKLMIMSGTPVVSWPLDLWSHLARLGPERIANERGNRMEFEEFRSRYHVTQRMPNPHSRYAPPIIKIRRARNLDDLHQRLEGWAVRRRKTEVLKDLPPMVARQWPVEANAKVRAQLMADLAEELPPDLIRRLERATTDSEMEIVMREVASSSAQVSAVQRLTGIAKAGAIAESVKAELSESTYKLGVFAWNIPVLDLIAGELSDFGVSVVKGSTSAGHRQQAVKTFQDGDKRVFVGQIQACGTALTLTAASRCIFAQVSWTPGDNAQAAARFHRIGQKDSVDVRLAFLSGSLDEAMSRVLQRKSEAAWSVIDA